MEYSKKEADRAVKFVRHIREHLDSMNISVGVQCKICDKFIDEIVDKFSNKVLECDLKRSSWCPGCENVYSSKCYKCKSPFVGADGRLVEPSEFVCISV